MTRDSAKTSGQFRQYITSTSLGGLIATEVHDVG